MGIVRSSSFALVSAVQLFPSNIMHGPPRRKNTSTWKKINIQKQKPILSVSYQYHSSSKGVTFTRDIWLLKFTRPWPATGRRKVRLVNLCGRGDKDMLHVAKARGVVIDTEPWRSCRIWISKYSEESRIIRTKIYIYICIYIYVHYYIITIAIIIYNDNDNEHDDMHIYMFDWWWLEHGFYDFPFIGNNHPNWRTHIFRGVGIQPTRL